MLENRRIFYGIATVYVNTSEVKGEKNKFVSSANKRNGSDLNKIDSSKDTNKKKQPSTETTSHIGTLHIIYVFFFCLLFVR